MKSGFTIIFCLSMMIANTANAMPSAKFCDLNRLAPGQTRLCSHILTDPGPEGIACLKKAVACGYNELVIDGLYVESLGLMPIQKYYLGLSLQSAGIQTRSVAERCEFARLSRQQLSGFLSDVFDLYSETGQFGSFGLEQIRNATKIIEQNETLQGCLTGLPSEAELQRLAIREAQSKILSYLLEARGESDDPLAPIFNQLQSFVSKSSELTSGAALRAVEIENNARILQAIQKDYGLSFGGVMETQATLSIREPTELSQTALQASIQKDRSDEVARQFKETVGQNQDRYPEFKSQTEQKLIERATDTAMFLNIDTSLFSQNATQQGLKPLEDDVHEALKSDKVGKAYNEIISDLQVVYRRNCIRPRSWDWFCQEGSQP